MKEVDFLKRENKRLTGNYLESIEQTDYSRRDTENVVMVDQAREIERLSNELIIKDQDSDRMVQENHKYKNQLNDLKEQLNRTLSFVKSENIPHYEVRKSQDLVEKVLALESYIKEQKDGLDRTQYSEYDSLCRNRFHSKFTPEGLTRNGIRDPVLNINKPLNNLYSNSANSQVYSRNDFEVGSPDSTNMKMKTYYHAVRSPYQAY